MASNSTTSNYTNQIKTNYPYRGQNNDSQGFRDNFSAIKNALTSADTDIQTLKGSLISNNTNSNFYDHKILRAVFQDCADQIYTSSESAGNIQIDYTQGSYQDFQLAGDTSFTVTGFPTTGYGSIIIACTPVASLQVTFPENATAIGVGTIQSDNISIITFWEIWSPNGGTNLFFNKIGNNTTITAVLTATDFKVTHSLSIAQNVYTTGTNLETVVAAGGQLGTIALLPNRIVGTINHLSTSTPDSSTLRFSNSPATQIKTGATTRFPTTSTLFTVQYISGPDVVITPAADNYSDLPQGSSTLALTFTNPTFSLQTIVSTFVPSAPTSVLGGTADSIGQIHANSTSLYVSYNNYDTVNQNWFKVSADTVARQLPTGTSATTVDIANSSTVLATTEFTQNLVSTAIYGGIEGALPPGVITLWYGTIANIPLGWALCNGATVNGHLTPDLRDKFVVGASVDSAGIAKTNVTGITTATGGTADSSLIQHTHTAGSVVSDPTHTHVVPIQGGNGSVNLANSLVGDLGQRQGATRYTEAAATGITVSTTLLNAGSGDGVNANLPPFYALAYIMKVV